MNYLLTATDELADFEGRGGGKALNLARMSQQGVSVPPWFCVSADA